MVESYREETGKELSYDQAVKAYQDVGREDIIFGGFDGRAMVATAMAEFRSGVLEYRVQSVFVQPEYRGAGLGRAILTELLSRTNSDYEGCYLLVKKNNTAAIALYRSLGFHINPEASANGDVNYMYRSNYAAIPERALQFAIG